MTPAVGVAFSSGADGDLRHDLEARTRFGASVGAAVPWATVNQVHGAGIATVSAPVDGGDADGLVTTEPGVALAVFTADCMGIVIGATEVVAVVHAGWRGLDAGVIEAAIDVSRRLGGEPTSAWIGPSIGPCCFEVGDEVAARFADHVSQTTWGTTSVDLRSEAVRRLGVETTLDDRCTRCHPGLFSHRADATPARLAAVGWLAA